MVLRFFLYFSLSLFSFSLCYADSFNNDWNLTSNIDGVKVWMLRSNSDVTGSWQEIVGKKSLDWSIVDQKNYFQSFEAKKKKMLSFVGISKWRADHYKWTKNSQWHELNVKGHYQDSSGQEIAFKEVHLFHPGKTIQILHTRPASLKNGEEFSKQFFSFIKPEVMNQ